jgi:hypothetical protein
MADNYTAVLMEELREQLRLVLEGQAALSGVPTELRGLRDDVDGLKADVAVIKAAVTDVSRILKEHGAQLDDHETRLRLLGAA